VPVTVTVKLPLAEGVHVRLDALEPLWVPGLIAQSKPVEGDDEYERSTMSLNPLIASTLIVEDPVTPSLMERLEGLTAIVKSVKWNRADTVAVESVVIPVIVTV